MFSSSVIIIFMVLRYNKVTSLISFLLKEFLTKEVSETVKANLLFKKQKQKKIRERNRPKAF